jgi:hypothetical protein
LAQLSDIAAELTHDVGEFGETFAGTLAMLR